MCLQGPWIDAWAAHHLNSRKQVHVINTEAHQTHVHVQYQADSTCHIFVRTMPVPCQNNTRCCFRNFWSPSLAPLRVRLGGRHGGSATSSFCADPCTHSGQDLNRLLCFRKFWNCGIWHFLFLVVCEDVAFSCVSGLGMAFQGCRFLSCRLLPSPSVHDFDVPKGNECWQQSSEH